MVSQMWLDTFFMNTMYKDHKLYMGDKGSSFLVDEDMRFRVCTEACKFKNNPEVYYAMHQMEQGEGSHGYLLIGSSAV